MSADHWGICPRCKAKREEELVAAEVEVGTKYGKVEPDDWDDLRAKANKLRARVEKPPEEDYTLREDEKDWKAENEITPLTSKRNPKSNLQEQEKT